MPELGQVCVLGLGYIGLPTAAVLADRGWHVHGVDVNPTVVEHINRGSAHIVEPEIDRLVANAVASGHLRASDEPIEANVFMICVPTPFVRDTMPPQPDLRFVLAAARSIAPVLRTGDLVIIESTCPVGATEEVHALLAKQGAPQGVRVAYCPERVLPGRILAELVTNDRVVGGINDVSSAEAKAFYRTFVRGEILTTDSRTAEMVKLTENSFRDVNIAFANEVSMLCERMGIDAWELIRLANHHPRVNILSPGPGVGGHCIAVDPWFIVAGAPEQTPLIRTAREVNDSKPDWVVDQIRRRAGSLGITDRPVRIACLGLAYKADIGDLRESPSERVALALGDIGFDILACEPYIHQHPKLQLRELDQAIEASDLVVLLVAHEPFLHADFRGKPVLDFSGAQVASVPVVATHGSASGSGG